LGNTPTGTTSDSTITSTPASGVVTDKQKQDAEDTLEAAKELGEPDSKTQREVFEAKKVLLAYGRQVATTKEKEQAKAQADAQARTGSVAPLDGVTPTAPAKTPKEKKFDDEKVNTLTTLKGLADKANVNVGSLVSSLLVADDVVESTGPQEFGIGAGRPGLTQFSPVSPETRRTAKFDNLAKALKIAPKDLVETLTKVDPKTKRTLLDSLKDTLTGGGNAAFFKEAGLDPELFTLLRQEPNVRRVLGLTEAEVASRGVSFIDEANRSGTTPKK
jgi:hypothetical protein